LTNWSNGKGGRGIIPRSRAFIFDLDGTLFDSRGIGRRMVLSWLPGARLMGYERLIRRTMQGRDLGSPEAYYTEFFRVFSGRTGRSPAFLRDWYFQRYLPHMERILGRYYAAWPGTGEFFSRLLAAGTPFAVYSDYPNPASRLRALGVEPPPGGRVFHAGDFGAQKPAPRPFLAIAEALGAPPASVCVAGDREDTDGAGARAAGMGFVRIINPGEKDKGITWTAFMAQASPLEFIPK
jgi:FMN phosphatase YigB (HAD superfamily)